MVLPALRRSLSVWRVRCCMSCRDISMPCSAGVACCGECGVSVLELPALAYFHGRCGEWLSGPDSGVAVAAGGLGRAALVLGLADPAGVFIVDATLTLGRRLCRGEKVYQAHRSHAYQVASRHYGRHLPVTVAPALINLFWLLPIACWVVRGWLASFWRMSCWLGWQCGSRQVLQTKAAVKSVCGVE